MLAMTLHLETRHDLTPNEVDAIEDRLYEHNSHATGRHDGQGLGFVIRDDAGQLIGAAAGYTWAGVSELKHMWVDKAYRWTRLCACAIGRLCRGGSRSRRSPDLGGEL